jgi:hypothetical protein
MYAIRLREKEFQNRQGNIFRKLKFKSGVHGTCSGFDFPREHLRWKKKSYSLYAVKRDVIERMCVRGIMMR